MGSFWPRTASTARSLLIGWVFLIALFLKSKRKESRAPITCLYKKHRSFSQATFHTYFYWKESWAHINRNCPTLFRYSTIQFLELGSKKTPLCGICSLFHEFRKRKGISSEAALAHLHTKIGKEPPHSHWLEWGMIWVFQNVPYFRIHCMFNASILIPTWIEVPKYSGTGQTCPGRPAGHWESRSGRFVRLPDQMSGTFLLTFYLRSL